LQAIWDNGVYAFRILFLTSEPDFSRYPIPGHSFFEVFPQVALLVGGVYFAVRPSWRKGFLLLMVLVGIAPFIFCQRPHTGRLFGAVAPMFLMGAWGMGACWDFFSREVKGSALRMALFLLLAVFWAWDGKTSFALFQGWTDYRTTNDAVIGRQLAQDWEKYRVIVAPHDHDFFQPQFAMLCDQRDVWSLNVPHAIDLGEGERGKDIALYIYGGDPATLEKARKDFPEAPWVDVPSLNGAGFMKKVMIPFSSLEEKPGKMIFVKRVPESYWRRRFYWADYPYGLARGIVGWDDRVADLSASLPAGMREGVTARVDGEMTATTAGDYSFSVPWWGENIELAIDGKKVHFTRRSDLGRATLYLGPGPHRVSWATTFKKSLASFQEITVTPPNGGREWILGRSS
jgi:hypothetical protein